MTCSSLPSPSPPFKTVSASAARTLATTAVAVFVHGLGRLVEPAARQSVSARAGELIRVDAEHEPELFWALRGGGGNYGIVTAIEFGVVKVHELYAGALFFPVERASEVLHTWNAARLLASNDGGFGNAKTLKPRATT